MVAPHLPRPVDDLPGTAPRINGMRHLTSTNTISRGQAEELFVRAERLAQAPRGRLHRILDGHVLGSLFYQNSTRTRLSFESAMRRLGGEVVGFDDVRTTRAGDFFAESLVDTVRVVGQYVDCIVLRHPDDGAAEQAAEVSPVPVVNAGDGANEHPTQALLDVGMLRRLLGRLTGTRIGMVGDPGCRDFRSLLQLLPKFGVAEVVLLPAPDTGFSTTQQEELRTSRLAWREVDDVAELLAASDAVCMLPVQLPTFHLGTVPPAERSPLDDRYRVTADKLRRARRPIPILHVGPRGAELPESADDLECVHYFEQVRYGMYLRAAIVEALIHNTAADG